MIPASRVISLAPTQTEIIAALGQAARLIGVTENCDYPREVLSIPKYGSWYAPDLGSVARSRPDLVCTFGQHQEEIAGALQDEGLRVYHSAPSTVDASLRTFEELSDLLGCRAEARELLTGLVKRLEAVKGRIRGLKERERPRVLRIMNWEPLVTVGPGAFQHDVIEVAGGRNVFAGANEPYVAAEHKDAQEKNPQLIFYCEGFITEAIRTAAGWSGIDAVKEGQLFVFDCGLTCRSGPRIVDMVEELARVMHPALFVS